MVDNITAPIAHIQLFQSVPPKAIAHNTPLYPIKPAFILSVSIPNMIATGIGRSVPNIV